MMSECDELDWRDSSTFYYHARPLRRAAMWLLEFLAARLMKLEISGMENVPAHGPLILAANHVTTFDAFPMQLAMPRPIFFMGKAELFKVSPFAGFFREMGVFPVYRGEHDAWALRHACRVLEAGQVLGMFPEGTRSRGRGLSTARTGAARLAIETECPILPMAVVGTDRIFKSFPHRTCVCVSFLQPITPDLYDTPQSLTDRLMRDIAEALPNPMRGAYASLPK